MTINVLKNISTSQLLATFNLAFSDYFIPFRLTLEQLQYKLLADHTDLNISVGAFDKDKLVGFICHGIQTVGTSKLVYNGGTGVIPEKRGHGLTARMYDFIIPVLKEKNVDAIVLEVISTNTQAIKSYEKVGFKTKRMLHCYKGNVTISKVSNAVEIRELLYYDWELMESFWDSTPTWQNAPHVLNKLKSNNHIFGAFINKTLVGYVIYNAQSKRLQQIAVNARFRRQNIASSIILHISKTFSPDLSIINVDEQSKSTNTFLQTIGLKHHLSQLEMRLDLKKQ
ncbi:GNAT family N-acetyltransferase [uncultured Psychroserpens sp.]|uniref:GNAT family N-acetyltransferase n=1 Tax=uncultured Psychroserpens sp. TaxID=255436 RepID=UPI00261F0C79|nr:GNAT family N-acetyltransferase [uncultured Psychroserpens sp.]